MNPRISDCALIAFALAALSVAGGMDLQDAQHAESVTQTAPVAPLDCRDKLNLRVALTVDEAAGRCDQFKGTTK